MSHVTKPGKRCQSKFSDGTAPLPEVDVAQLKKVYRVPAHDKTRLEYAQRYEKAQRETNVDAGGDGLKHAAATFENSWYIAAALVMTIGFTMIMYVPAGFSMKQGEVTEIGDLIAVCAYFILVMFGTINSSLGVWWAGHGVAQVDWHPAATFGFFWFASLNTTLGQCQQFAKASIIQLVLALVPLSYLQYGGFGLLVSALAVVYMYVQIYTWQQMGGLMREGYKTGLMQGSPVVLDVADVPAACQQPFSADWLSMVSGQFVNTFGYALRGWFGGCPSGTGGKPAHWLDVASGEVVVAVSGTAVAEDDDVVVINSPCTYELVVDRDEACPSNLHVPVSEPDRRGSRQPRAPHDLQRSKKLAGLLGPVFNPVERFRPELREPNSNSRDVL